MAKAINHKERKRDIRAMSLKLFAQHGFAAVNFGMIAKECGVARTLLYTYFKDKRTIFNEAVDEATSSIADLYLELKHSKISADAKLRQLCVAVLALLHDNRDFLCVIVDLLREYKRNGKLKVENIIRHTVGMKRIIHTLIVEAKHRLEYSPQLNANQATTIIYSQFEAAILRITVSGGAEFTDSVNSLNAILNTFP